MKMKFLWGHGGGGVGGGSWMAIGDQAAPVTVPEEEEWVTQALSVKTFDLMFERFKNTCAYYGAFAPYFLKLEVVICAF